MTITLNGYEAEVFYAYLCHSMELLQKNNIPMADVEMDMASKVEEQMDRQLYEEN